MALTNEQIITSLVAYYRRNGVDLTYLLGDPTFQSMKTWEKVEAIKRHAKEIYENSTSGLTRSEKIGIATNAGFSAFGAIPVALTLSKDLPKLGLKNVHATSLGKATALAAGAGLLAGAIGAGFTTHNARAERRALRNELRRTAVDPSTNNAVAVLANHAIQNHTGIFRRELARRAANMMNAVDPKEIIERERAIAYDSDMDRTYPGSRKSQDTHLSWRFAKKP